MCEKIEITNPTDSLLYKMLKGIRNLVFGKPPPPTWDATVPFIPPVEKCHVIKVYDGDTITVAANLPFDKTLYRS